MMPAHRAFLVIAVISIGVATFFLFPFKHVVEQAVPRQSGAPASTLSRVPVSPAVAPGSGEAPSEIAAALNAPEGNIRRDLEIASELFVAWQSSFPGDGNPVGENAEITAALTGKNRLEFPFLPRGHRAINGRGELCDRWGTPFRLHQLSGTQMEIRSAGPDRKFASADDAIWPAE